MCKILKYEILNNLETTLPKSIISMSKVLWKEIFTECQLKLFKDEYIFFKKVCAEYNHRERMQSYTRFTRPL